MRAPMGIDAVWIDAQSRTELDRAASQDLSGGVLHGVFGRCGVVCHDRQSLEPRRQTTRVARHADAQERFVGALVVADRHRRAAAIAAIFAEEAEANRFAVCPRKLGHRRHAINLPNHVVISKVSTIPARCLIRHLPVASGSWLRASGPHADAIVFGRSRRPELLETIHLNPDEPEGVLRVAEVIDGLLAAGKRVTVTVGETHERLSPQEAADRLGCSRGHVVRLIDAGELFAEKLANSSCWRIQSGSVVAFEERRDRGRRRANEFSRSLDDLGAPLE